MILTTPINGKPHPIFLNKKNALGTHTQKEREEYFMSIGTLKLSYMLSKTSFVPRKCQLGCLLTTVQKELDIMNPISTVFYRNFTLINYNPMYPNALDLQNGLWIINDRGIHLIYKPNDMFNCRVKRQLINLCANGRVFQ